MYQRTYKPFICNSPESDQPAMASTQPSLELEPVPQDTTEPPSSPTESDEASSSVREKPSDPSSPKRFKICLSDDESDIRAHITSPVSPVSEQHTLDAPSSINASATNTSHTPRTAPLRTESRLAQSGESQGQNRRPTTLFQIGRAEEHEEGHPTELVTPENRPIRDNNEVLLNIVFTVWSPVTHRDNNNRQLHNNPGDYRRTQSY